MQSRQRQNGQLGAGIAAVEIFGGVGLGISAGLRFFQRLAERNPGVLDAAQNVVAGSIQNSGNAVQAVSAQAGAQRGENGHSSGHRGAELKLASLLRGQLQKIGAVARDQLLVGRDHRLAGLQRRAHDLLRRIQAADQFDHDVGVGAEHRLNVVGPDDIAWNPGLLLLFDVAVADVGEAERLVVALAQNFGDGAADGSEADEGDAADVRLWAASGSEQTCRHRLENEFSSHTSICSSRKWNSISYVASGRSAELLRSTKRSGSQ